MGAGREFRLRITALRAPANCVQLSCLDLFIQPDPEAEPQPLPNGLAAQAANSTASPRAQPEAGSHEKQGDSGTAQPAVINGSSPSQPQAASHEEPGLASVPDSGQQAGRDESSPAVSEADAASPTGDPAQGSSQPASSEAEDAQAAARGSLQPAAQAEPADADLARLSLAEAAGGVSLGRLPRKLAAGQQRPEAQTASAAHSGEQLAERVRRLFAQHLAQGLEPNAAAARALADAQMLPTDIG